jgi:hypothetical protein
MSDIEIVVKYSKKIEHILETKYNASGKGLHSKINSVQNELPEKIIKTLRYVATIRNKIIHQNEFDKIPNKTSFIKQCEEMINDLKFRKSLINILYSKICNWFSKK